MTRRLTLLLVLGLAAGCATSATPHRTRPSIFAPAERSAAAGAAEPQAAFSAEQLALIETHCAHGLPKWSGGKPPGPMDWVFRSGYVLQHSATDKIALFVCEHVEKKNLKGTVKRRDPFKPDPVLKAGRRAELADYKASGYSRGHQAPSADQMVSQDRNDETFFLSNMTPQRQALNGGIWETLEKQVRAWAEKYGQVWVLTGPMFYDPAEDDPQTADGSVNYDVIGDHEVAVPTHYFKIVVAEIDGAPQALAFVFRNEGYPKDFELSKAQVSIDWIEDRIGLDFMPDLTPEQERALEHDVGKMWRR